MLAREAVARTVRAAISAANFRKRAAAAVAADNDDDNERRPCTRRSRQWAGPAMTSAPRKVRGTAPGNSW